MRKNSRNSRLFLWIKRKVWKIPDGEIMPKPLIFVRSILMPLNTIYYLVSKRCDIYDPERNTYTINGVKFSSGVFDFLSDSHNKGLLFKFENLENGAMTIKVVEHFKPV